MTIQFNYQHVSGSTELENYTKDKLQTIFDRYSWVTRADVFFIAENTSSDQTGMIAQIRLSAPGPRLFAEESHDTFTESVSKVVDQLKTQCEKRKATIIPHS
ncbi:HPF/RaiA family ribosome-associated protein [Nonlabens sp. Ci31]|jgi:putative sigma-54 modulation protein|uniref:HPF/RaiA family ribosome-associated protein n=1 Tax=Nonlabens sp. Ci31 TaxID=2608253 RepID=UPI0014646B55|nr:HPF/RaiA family ribosome-associated protein [Nonlabens sp. Ci31]QJP35261.1 HPF/RaiA family ribosome-associated protein [Nonlabens sp. Ci31]